MERHVGNLGMEPEVFRENVVKENSRYEPYRTESVEDVLKARLHLACVGLYGQEITHFPGEESFTSSLNSSYDHHTARPRPTGT